LVQAPYPGEDYIGPWQKQPSLASGRSISFSRALRIDAEVQPHKLKIKKVHWHPNVERCLAASQHVPRDSCTQRTPLPDVALIEVDPTSDSDFQAAPTVALSHDEVERDLAIVMMGFGSQGEGDVAAPRLKYFHGKVASDDALQRALVGTEAERDGWPNFDIFFGALGRLHEDGLANLGSGDSGGPVLRVSDGAVVGINSDGYCPLANAPCQQASQSIFSRLDNQGPYKVAEWLGAFGL
jgi:hypothetical protein